MIKRLLSPIALLAAVAALAGCGGEDAAVAVADAAERTQEVSSARVDVEGTVEGPGLPGPTTYEATGVVDNEAQVGQLEFEDFQIPGDVAGTLPPDALEGEVVFDGFEIYMQLPILTASLPEGKSWLKLDLQSALEGQGVDLGQLGSIGQSNPTATLRQLEAVSEDLEDVGEEDVRGVPTTHYEATVDLTRYPDVVPEEEREAVQESVDALIELTGTETIPTEVWVDEDGLVRRFSQSYSYDQPPAGEVRQSQTIEFSDFGTEVDVEIPPEDEVFDATDLATQPPIP